jgi:hypothetical protein
MIIQTTLLTCHKGVDLHADTAERVIRNNLPGGERLLVLHRAELHTFWHEDGAEAPDSVERMLTVGRFFNPNKHRYLHCELKSENTPWFEAESQRGFVLPENWPGSVLDTDLEAGNGTLDKLFGTPQGIAVDVCAFPLGESGPVISGVLWRLLIDADNEADAVRIATGLIETRDAGSGLLVNPHMEGWLTSHPALREV